VHANKREGMASQRAVLLFHVGAHPIPVGQILRPYALAREHHSLLRQSWSALADGFEAVEHLLDGVLRNVPSTPGRYRPEMVLLEAIFERVRRNVRPEAPSRLEVVFTWGTRSVAERFCAEYYPGAVIHRCTLVEGMAVERGGALVVAAFEAFDQPGPLAGRLRGVEERAEQYWRAQEPMGFPELLVRGIVRVDAVDVAGKQSSS
jgi:hypothetical protein